MPRTDSANKTVDASPARVFAALTDPKQRRVWLPPTGMTGRFEWFDARAGGGYRMVLTYDDPSIVGKHGDNTDVAEVRFVEIELDRRVVEQVVFDSDDPSYAGTMTITWGLQPSGDATSVTITATDVPDGISSADHQQAFASTLANLAAFLVVPSHRI